MKYDIAALKRKMLVKYPFFGSVVASVGYKENKDIQFLSNFTYETRSSSREFCNKLIQAKIDFTSSNLIEQIKDSSWFMPFWDNDPTIKSMFRMIQDIHKMFNEYDLFEKLNLITFEF